MKRTLSTPVKTPRKVKLYRPTGTTPKKKSTDETVKVKKSVGYAARCIEYYGYKKAFTYLYNNFPGARRAVQHLIRLNVRREVRSLLKEKESVLMKTCTLENMMNFKWSDVLKEAEKHMPLFTTTIKSAVTTQKNEKSLLGYREKPLTLGMTLSVAVIMHLRAPHNIKLVQGIHSLELWRYGSQRKLFQHFGRFGLCTSFSTALRLLSKIRVHADGGVVRWKSKIEEMIETGIPAPMEEKDTDKDVVSSDEEVEEPGSGSSPLADMSTSEDGRLESLPETESSDTNEDVSVMD